MSYFAIRREDFSWRTIRDTAIGFGLVVLAHAIPGLVTV